ERLSLELPACIKDRHQARLRRSVRDVARVDPGMAVQPALGAALAHGGPRSGAVAHLWFRLRNMAENLAPLLRLMLVTDERLLEGRDLVAVCLAAVRGGVTSVELRLKRVTPRELLARARELVAALPVPVLVNDRLDVALAAGAAGVHLGPDDLPVALARRAVP